MRGSAVLMRGSVALAGKWQMEDRGAVALRFRQDDCDAANAAGQGGATSALFLLLVVLIQPFAEHLLFRIRSRVLSGGLAGRGSRGGCAKSGLRCPAADRDILAEQ